MTSSDPGNLNEQKLWQGAAGIGGLAWDDNENYVQYLRQYADTQPARTGHPLVFGRLNPQESLNRLDVIQTRYQFPGGLQYQKWGFTGDMKSSDGAAMGGSFIPGNSSSTTEGIWQHAT